MSLESDRPPQEITEQKKDSPLCVFIAGAGGTNKGLGGIDTALKSVYGESNVLSYNSAFSPDKPNRQKYTDIAETVETTIAAGREVELVVHSLGATEAQKVIKKIEKRDPTYFDNTDNVKKLHLKIVAAPGFFDGLLSAGKTLKALGKLGKESAFSKTLLHAADSINAFPPEGISQDDLHKAMRTAFKDKTLYDETVQSVGADSYTDYSDKLDPEECKIVADFDAQLRAALDQKDFDRTRKIVLQRGKALLPQLSKIYAGEYFDQSNNSAQDTLDGKWTVGAFLGLTGIMSDMFTGVPKRKFKQLEKKGVQVDFIIPEYDMMMPLSNVVNFFEGDTEKMQKHTTIMRGHAHSTLALQANPLAKAVSNR